MRVSPLGVWGWNLAPEKLAKLAAQDSRLSHPSPVAQAACVVFCHALAFAIRTGCSAKEVYEEALAFTRRTSLAMPVLDSLEAAGAAPPADFQAKMGWVRVAFQNAFFQLVQARTFEEGVVGTVASDGDTDTNACIAGALLGAVHGAGAVPAQWRGAVLGCRTSRPPECWCVDLEELATRLCFPAREAGREVEEGQRPTASKGKVVRYVAVADLHGHLEQFERIVALADETYGTDYVLVGLGDYVDNGPEIPALLDRLIELKQERGDRFVPIMGNHDLACARVLGWQGAAPDEAWWAQWLENFGGGSTARAYGAGSARALAKKMPQEHQAFLQGLPWFFETPEYVFVHAGLKAEALGPQLEELEAKQLPADPRHTNPQLRDKGLAAVSFPGWGKVIVSAHTRQPAPSGHVSAPHFASDHRVTLAAESDKVEGRLWAVALPERQLLLAEAGGGAKVAGRLPGGPGTEALVPAPASPTQGSAKTREPTAARPQLLLEAEGQSPIRVLPHKSDRSLLVLKASTAEAGAEACRRLGIVPQGPTWKGQKYFLTAVNGEAFLQAVLAPDSDRN